VKAVRTFLDKQARHFEKGGKLHRLFFLWEAVDTFLYTPGKTTRGTVHVRDFMDLKRLMIVVFVALLPAVFMALYNTGWQANSLLIKLGADAELSWQARLVAGLGLALDPTSFWSNILLGAFYFFPVYFVTLAAGGFWEVLFASVRRH